MGKNKNSKADSIEQQIAFLTDDTARSKGIPTWLTGDTSGREPIGNLLGAYKYLGNTDEQRKELGLDKGEINPYLMTEVAGQEPSKSMYKYWASDAMPQLPKDIRKQYDVVYAGVRPREPRDFMLNTKFGDALAPKEEQNVWKFVPRNVKTKEEEDSTEVAQAVDQAVGDDRPVQVGTLSYAAPGREGAVTDPNSFLNRYIHTIGVA